ncbi:MAG: PilZ domain-containing protein, partial [Myxococcota bacterium]|nr:PilZ domain-containing protein [Myxococcota bacterium]
MSDPNTQSDMVHATLTTERGRALSGSLIEVGPRTVALAFDQSGDLGLALGERVTFVLSGDLVGSDHKAEGNITGWREAGGLQICSIRYKDAHDYKKLLATQVGRTFNRRNSFRVRPADNRPVNVSLEGASDSGTGIATDVSSTGMGVIPERALDVTSGEEMTVTLRMPDDPRPASLKAVLCHIGQGDNGPRYGLDFIQED